MSFGSQATPGPAKELKRSPRFLTVAGRRCGNKERRKKRREKGKKEGKGKLCTHDVL